MPTQKRLRPMGYKDALRWILRNDDTEFLHDGSDMPSVTATLVADIYDRGCDEVMRDLRKMQEKGVD